MDVIIRQEELSKGFELSTLIIIKHYYTISKSSSFVYFSEAKDCPLVSFPPLKLTLVTMTFNLGHFGGKTATSCYGQFQHWFNVKW